MRRIFAILFALCLCLSLTAGVMAAPYADISALFQYWEEFGYPADVAGVYSTDGSAENLTVMLIGDNDGSREAEIRAMLNDDSGLTVEAGSYSQERLQSINQEISEFYMFEGSGIYGCGIGWGQDGGFGASGSEFRVVVTAEEDRVEEYRSMFSRIYDDAVVVEAGQPPVLTMEEELQLGTELPEAPEGHDLYGDLSEEPIEAPQKELTEGAAAEKAAPENGQTPGNADASGMSTATVLMIVGGIVIVVLVVVILLRRKKK
ncbi:MAG: LPXTG cell wall anchor domain-containing protein [Ruminococcaceae bacterium]|nr:LPXTG cell wall anchor domain-containing protein [Oscillospiraceae bacterium]